MTKILIDEAVVRQALEALEDFEDAIRYDNEQDDIGAHVCCGALSYNPHTKNCRVVKAITTLQEALAEQQAQQEPVYVQTRHKDFTEWGTPLDPKYRHSKWAEGVEMRLLYATTPPAPAQPLTQDMVESCPYDGETLRGAFFDGWLKAEAAHGITKTKGN
jgi:hypothetical protein